MIDALDQIFVNLKPWLVGQLPADVQPWAALLLSVLPLMAAMGLLFAVVTVIERKGLGRLQNRLGPNRVGPFGILQPVADGLKALTKEDFVPAAADRVVHFLAPVLFLVIASMALAVLPYGRNMTPVDLDGGVLYFFAVGAGGELAVFMAGWSSRNKYSLLGAMRGIAQMVSYEMPLVLASVTVVMAVGSLMPARIVEAQAGYGVLGLPHWHVLTPWGLAGFVLFLVAALAESNRSPFDLPEGESEIVAGHFVEYSGFKFALFFMAEYFGMFAVSGLAITLFLGGWHAPLPFLGWLPSWFWFFAKLLSLVCLFIWVRGTVPRVRVDQLMSLAWKLLLPMTLLNLAVVAVWHYTRVWGFPGAGPARWVLCGLMLAGPFLGLTRALAGGRVFAPRTYRYAD